MKNLERPLGSRPAPLLVLLVLFALAVSPIALAQAGAPSSEQEGQPASAEETGDEQQPAAEESRTEYRSGATYSYRRAGRRDPFKSLLERSTDRGGQRPEGLPGIAVSEIDILGIIKRSDGSFMAIIQGASKETFNVRAGDRLFDGEVENIHQDRVVFRQRLDDPTLAKNYRTV